MATTREAHTTATRAGAAEVAPAGCSREGAVTRSLLGYGVLAGPDHAGVSVAFAGLATGSTMPALNIAFTAATMPTWVWLSVTSLDQYRKVT
jgi:hypothetical protein